MRVNWLGTNCRPNCPSTIQDHDIGALRGHEVAHGGLIGEVQFGVGANDQVEGGPRGAAQGGMGQISPVLVARDRAGPVMYPDQDFCACAPLLHGARTARVQTMQSLP